jgi:PAS domain S-box-containing protein
MGLLHRNVSWLVFLFALICISAGFAQILSEIQRREMRLRRLFDSNIIGVFIWGPDSQIVDANEAFLRIVGYGHDDVASGRLRWRDLSPPEWRDADDRREAELSASGTVHPYEKECFHRSGRRVPVLVGASTFEREQDQGVAFVLDLTERKAAEAATLESERRYREVEMQLTHANRVATLGQLSASISHEVNQPIAAAVTDAHAALRWLAMQPPVLEEVQQALDRVVKNGNRASDIIGRIHALVIKAPARKGDFEINEAILEVIALTRREMVKNGISVQTQLAEGLPLIQGDRVQLQQVVLNLVINAVEAMSALSEGPRELLISSDITEADGVSVAFRDSGPGLSAASREHVFEAFYTTKSDGLGMGLSICRSIIETHGGRLWATEGEPRGAAFIFTLPAHPERTL